eukprot:6186648-Pleurochrysis_carterae.AAC.3
MVAVAREDPCADTAVGEGPVCASICPHARVSACACASWHVRVGVKVVACNRIRVRRRVRVRSRRREGRRATAGLSLHPDQWMLHALLGGKREGGLCRVWIGSDAGVSADESFETQSALSAMRDERSRLHTQRETNSRA